ncbi:BZ3500_MvSof-1268-A1-R1_Chr9g10807 [Microbotryum saponariae]|uniref:BZ3500_MvSof-1268-A1-R1_Chr9g10807 protein n=1 Tax=Microbotryum saponariae TaxID=289078 RepID=A0A2X0N7C3_9BASI|nr:BZ3501_MvSof-1269-A2-R1_Chr9g10555 [Microbotryum saponariae]SDA00727.1 BZ3500_MvSof-1268-A1-R1_Chr9g10807 [Microbotryum saponariae]
MDPNNDIFQSPYTLLYDGSNSDYHPCGKVDDFSYRAIGTPFQGAPLPPSSQLPVSAILDTSLQQRLEGALLDFLGAHDLLEPVYNETRKLLLHVGQTRLFCTNSPECIVSMHDLRIRILEPLVTIALKKYHDKIEEDGKKSGGIYLLHYRPEDPIQPQLPRGITFALRHTITGVASNTTISFEEDSSFLTFGCQPNGFAREDECKFFLNEGEPIPLDPCGRSHGVQAMLNKLVWRMQSAIQRDPKTGKVEVPVRFGIIMSTHFAILAESVTNPNNDQEAGLVYTPIFKTGNDVKDRDRDAFNFRPKSIPLLFLAIILDYLVKVPPPPDKILNLLFGTGKHLDDSSGDSGVEGQTKPERSEEGDGEHPTGLENKRQTTGHPSESDNKGLPDSSAHVSSLSPSDEDGSRNWVNRGTRIEAVTFEVVSKPGKPLKARDTTPVMTLSTFPPQSSVVLSDLKEVKLNTLPVFAAAHLLGEGGFGSVTAGRLVASTAAIRDVDPKDRSSKAPEVGSSPIEARNEDSTDSRSSSIPTLIIAGIPILIIIQDLAYEAAVARSRWVPPADRQRNAPPEAHYPRRSGGSRSLFSFKLAHLLDPLWWRTQAHHLSSSTASARLDVLDGLSSQLAQFDSLLRASDNVVANKAVQLLGRSTDHPTTTQTLQLISTYSPYWFPAFLIFLTSLYSRRSSRLSEQGRIERHISARLQARAYAITDKMFDLGLGTPSAEGMPSGNGSGKGWGEVEVQWGKENFNITGVAPDQQKLIYSGAILKDDLAPLSSFGLIDNPQPISTSSHSTIPSSTRSFWDTWALLGSSQNASRRKLKKLILLGSKDVSAQIDERLMNRADLLPTGAEEIVPLKSILTEEQVIEKVDQVAQNKLKDLLPDLEKVERWIASVEGGNGNPRPQVETETATATEMEMEKPNPRTLIFLSEALLQALLKLDSIEVQSGYDRARAARKQGVRDLQAALDSVDALKPRFKKALAKE